MRTVVLGVYLICTALLYAQGERGAFTGTVTDSSGSAVPRAVISATHSETNIETKAVSTDTGVYRIPYLPLGTYRLTASAPGFRTAVAENVILRVAATATVDFKLELGQVTESVTVSADAAQLESSTAEIGRYVSKTEFDTWPIAVNDGHRQLQSFIFRALPGKAASSRARSTAGSSTRTKF